MVESWVEPAISASVNTIISIAGSASEAIITSRLEPMPPKLVPTSSPASARKKRALPSSAMMAMRSADQREQQPAAEGRHQRGRDPGGGEDEIGDDAEQPGGVVGQHHLLAHAAARDRDRAGCSGGPRRRSSRAFTLRTKPVSSGASSSTSSICAPCTARSRITAISRAPGAASTSAREDEAEILADGQELQMVEPLGGESDAAGDRRIERVPDRDRASRR